MPDDPDKPGARAPVSACIIAMDEADRIADCIRSLDWCDEVLVVDSHSSDDTRGVAAALGARVVERDWPGHVAQKEFAIRAARHDWVFCIDADERVSEAVASIATPACNDQIGQPSSSVRQGVATSVSAVSPTMQYQGPCQSTPSAGCD